MASYCESRLKSALAVATALLAVAWPVERTQADTTTLSELTASHDRVMEDPGNLEFLYDYARAAIRLGNYEAAIGALEGILIVAGNQPGLLLQIGTLYQRLDAPRTAQSYFERAREYSEQGSDVAAASKRFLDTIDKQTAEHSFSGFLRGGLRYQTNPARAPEADEILSGGVPIPTPGARQPEEDVNAFLLSRAEHRYAWSRRMSAVSDALLYGTAYDEQDRLNYALLELSAGIQYTSPASAAGQYSVRPYLLYRASELRDFATEQTPGAGLELRLRPDASSRFRAGYEYRDRDLDNANGAGGAGLRDGAEHRVELRYLWEFAPGQALSARIFGRSRRARREFLEVDEWELSLAYSTRVHNVVFKDQARMTWTPYVARRVREFGAPDVSIDPSTTREDKEWRVGLSYQLPFTATWSFYANYEYDDVDSNLVNFDADNNIVVVGLQRGF